MKRELSVQPLQAAMGVTLEGIDPGKWVGATRAVRCTLLGTGVHYLAVDLDSLECERIITQLKQEGRAPRSSQFNLYVNERWWESPEPIWAAAEFVSDNWADVSTTNSFSPICPPPCYGFVPARSPLDILKRPKGLVVALKNDMMFSRQLAIVLAELTPCQFGDVHVKGEHVREYVRLFPQRSDKILATNLMYIINCAACGCPIVAFRGAMLGRRREDLILCRNEEGIGHLGAEHPVLVSIDVAVRLRRQFPKGFGLNPILDISSSLGQRIQYLCQQLSELGSQ